MEDSGLSVSLGDVLRTTFFLHLKDQFKKILWLTSPEAVSLIGPSSNVEVMLINHFNIHDPGILPQDWLILNFERTALARQIINSINSRVIGYVFDGLDWVLTDYLGNCWTIENWIKHCDLKNQKTWGQKLLALTDFKIGQTTGVYSLVSQEKKYDIGLNWQVGNKWPKKQWPIEVWRKIESELNSLYSISWQEGAENLNEYSKWLSSCRLIITADSLGLHLAMAMGIPVIGLFGPTDYNLIDASANATFLQFNPAPEYDDENMTQLYLEVKKIFNEHYKSTRTL